MAAQIGEFVMVKVLELAEMLAKGDVVNSSFNRDDKNRWPTKSVANFFWRLQNSFLTREVLRQKGVLSPLNLGTNDPILMSVNLKTGKLQVENGWHRCKEIVNYCFYAQMFKRASGNVEEIPWYNDLLAGKDINTIDKLMAACILNSEIPIIIVTHENIHQRGCNNNQRYIGAEVLHSQYGGSLYAQLTSSMGPIYKNSPGEPEVHRMFSFGVMAGIQGPNTKLAESGFELFGNSAEAAKLTEEAFQWWRSFKFLNLSTPAMPVNLNLVGWRAVCYLAQQRWAHDGFPGAGRSLKGCSTDKKKWTKLMSMDGAPEDVSKRHLLVATYTLKELKKMTRGLKKQDDELLDIINRETAGGGRDSVNAGKNWLKNPKVKKALTASKLLSEEEWVK